MKETANPHDSFFKELFSRPAVAREFLARHLPPKVAAALDLATLETLKDSFVDKELQAHFSDLVFRVRLASERVGYVVLLFEHKSFYDRFTPLQLLRYQEKIWGQAEREGVKYLPPIFPLVFYHGQRRWPRARNFGALFDLPQDAELRRYFPDFEYYLFDAREYDEAAAGDSPLLRVGLALLKYIFQKDLGERLPELFKSLRDLPARELAEYLATAAQYVKRAPHIKKAEIGTALYAVFSAEEGEVMQTIIDEWMDKGLQKGLRQGLQQGLEQGQQLGQQLGQQQGQQQGAVAVAVRLLHKRCGELGPDVKQRVKDLSFAQLEDMSEALFDFQTVADLKAWLDAHETTH